jgi:hypothetical protein
MKDQESSTSNHFKRKILKVIKDLADKGENLKAFELYQKYFQDK